VGVLRETGVATTAHSHPQARERLADAMEGGAEADLGDEGQGGALAADPKPRDSAEGLVS
jgi:hypothetical protein